MIEVHAYLILCFFALLLLCVCVISVLLSVFLVPLFLHLFISAFMCSCVSLLFCFCVSLFLGLFASVFHDFLVSLFLCFCASAFLYFLTTRISVSLFLSVSFVFCYPGSSATPNNASKLFTRRVCGRRECIKGIALEAPRPQTMHRTCPPSGSTPGRNKSKLLLWMPHVKQCGTDPASTESAEHTN